MKHSWLFLLIIYSCRNSIEKTNENLYNLKNLQSVSKEVLNLVDTKATISIPPFSNSDSIKINVDNISLNDSEESARLLKDYLLADIFTQKNKNIPKFIEFDLKYKRGLIYEYNCYSSTLAKNDYKDTLLVNYIRFLLINIKAEDAAYFKLTTAIINDFYIKCNYNSTLLNLLLHLYFSPNDKHLKTQFLVFYANSDFPFDDLSINRTILDSVFMYNNIEGKDWTRNKVKEFYLDTYGLDTIKTIENEIHYIRPTPQEQH